MSCLRSHHLVLWSLETLTDQHRFYGTRLVTLKGRYYHLLSVLYEVGCIADYIPNSSINEYSMKNTFNSSVDKYHIKKGLVFLTLTSLNIKVQSYF